MSEKIVQLNEEVIRCVLCKKKPDEESLWAYSLRLMCQKD